MCVHNKKREYSKQNKIKDETKPTCIKGIKQVLKSQLNGRNKIQAINSYAIPVIINTAGIKSWTQNEIAESDRKTRKTTYIYGGLHPRADINRQYVPRNKGGRVLSQVKCTILSKEMALQEYVNNIHLTDRLLNAVWQRNKYHVPELDSESW